MSTQTLYEVVYPLGRSTEKQKPKSLAPRVPDLNGKTVCEFGRMYRTDITFPIIRELLKRRFPDVRIVPYTEILSSLAERDVPRIVAAVRERAPDVLIGGNGG